MTPPPSRESSELSPQVWQLDAAAHLLATLDERYAALRASASASPSQLKALMSQLDAADTELSVARASFLDAVCQLEVENAVRSSACAVSTFTAHECMFDALDVLWEFEAAWQKALEKTEDLVSEPPILGGQEQEENFES